MAILAVTYGLPWPLTEGSKQRDYYLLQELAKENEVVLLSFCKDDRGPHDVAELRRFCKEVHIYVPPGRRPWTSAAAHMRAGRPIATLPFYCEPFARRIAELCRVNRMDLVQIEHSFLAPYRMAIPPACPAILSLHNIGARQYASMARLSGAGFRGVLKAWAMRKWEVDWARRFDRCLTVSAQEAEWLRRRAPNLPVTVVENGIDCDRLRPLPPAAGSNDLLFVGVLGYPPNADAVVQFVRRTLPVLRRSRPELKLLIVGRSPRPDVRALAGSDGVELHADVPDVTAFYRRARACVVPLRAGGGTRVKILEAMALGRPVISTPAGCEGLEVTHEDHLLIAERPAAMAAEVERVLSDRRLADGICDRARRWVEQRHDWRIPGAILRQVHRELSARPAEALQ
jgi:glycosyltransferase involved in cell wall biosynthesis